jgi:peroxiredoxin
VARLESLQHDLGDAVTLLSDPDAAMIGAFGMVDPGGFPPGVAKARAGIVHVDARGIVRHVWLTPDYRARPDVDALLRALKG